MNNFISFEDISNKILENKRFQKLTNESHHGITRLEHSMRVAKYVYRISKRLNIDYVSATRAAVLHDFFSVNEFGNVKGITVGVIHPSIALENAKGEFTLNKIEENAIEAHMFPLSLTLPKYKESWVLTLVDKAVATYEYLSYKFSYTKLTSKITAKLSLVGILLFNILTMGRK